MKDERMMILAMLEEGKISSDEAAKLIEAIDESENKKTDGSTFIKKSEEDNSNRGSHKTKFKEKTKSSKDNRKWEEKFEEKIGKFEKKVESKFGKDFEKKMEKHGEELGVKMGKIGENIAEGTLSFTDKVMDMVENLVDKGTLGNLFGNYETIDEKIEKDISTLENPELIFESVNGKITLNPWDEDSILVDVHCRLKNKDLSTEESLYDVIEENNKVIFMPLHTNNVGIKLEVNIPRKSYNLIKATTTNGKIEGNEITSDNIIFNTTNSSIYLSDSTTDKVDFSTKNGKIVFDTVKANSLTLKTSNSSINLDTVTCEEVDAVTQNGRIIMDELVSKKIYAKTSNGSINLDDCKAEAIKAVTSNGKILIDDIDTNVLNYLYMKTSNSSVNVSFTDINCPFDIDAATTLGHLGINIPNLVYDVNNQKQLGSKKIVAQSPEYTEESGIKLIVSTSNGSIDIN